MRSASIALCLLLAALSGLLALTRTNAEGVVRYDAEGIYERSSPSVFYIRNLGEYDTTRSVGTGVIVSPDGLAVTAYHVIKGASRLEAVLQDKAILTIEVAAYDETNDIALLKLPELNEERYPALPIRTAGVRHGEQVFAIGYPLKETAIITQGIINSPQADINGRSRILTSAQIASGMSGGPLLDREGRVAGIISGSLRTMEGIHLIVNMSNVEVLINRERS